VRRASQGRTATTPQESSEHLVRRADWQLNDSNRSFWGFGTLVIIQCRLACCAPPHHAPPSRPSPPQATPLCTCLPLRDRSSAIARAGGAARPFARDKDQRTSAPTPRRAAGRGLVAGVRARTHHETVGGHAHAPETGSRPSAALAMSGPRHGQGVGRLRHTGLDARCRCHRSRAPPASVPPAVYHQLLQLSNNKRIRIPRSSSQASVYIAHPQVILSSVVVVVSSSPHAHTHLISLITQARHHRKP
jgi:hypothetical protein